VIAVTASVMPIEREEILAAGFDGYQAKPLSVKELLAEVAGLIAKRPAR
jgi:CheY-like chemotaxis protein